MTKTIEPFVSKEKNLLRNFVYFRSVIVNCIFHNDGFSRPRYSIERIDGIWKQSAWNIVIKQALVSNNTWPRIAQNPIVPQCPVKVVAI